MESRVQISVPTIPPEIFKQYEDASPGLGMQVVHMIEAESEHRRSLQRVDMEAQIRIAEHPHLLKARGQFCATLAIVAVLAFAFCILKFCPTAPGVSWVAGGVTGTTLLGIVGAFIYGQRAGRSSRRSEDS